MEEKHSKKSLDVSNTIPFILSCLRHPTVKVDDAIYEALIASDIIDGSNLNIFESGEYDKLVKHIKFYIEEVKQQIADVVPINEIKSLFLTQSYYSSSGDYVIELASKSNREDINMWDLSNGLW